MIESVHKDTKEKMSKSVEALKKDLKRVRTGRASASLLDGIRVDYYGTPTPLAQMASVSVPESRMLTIQPWDVSAIKEIEKAIQKSDLGLTPSNDGKIIRINVCCAIALLFSRSGSCKKSFSRACCSSFRSRKVR